ncbi:hypothetical protein B0H19DRAFT_712702 [Mycena capillaripes]|nr:hypothetical protein B0H19DRAFT_712702 [Mycena capillaripes]
MLQTYPQFSMQKKTPAEPQLLAISAREQCLRNSELLEEILPHISLGENLKDLKAARQSLLSIASASKALSPSALKFLWRRLDNLLPLLRLLPSFASKGNKYGLLFATESSEWLSFDRYAPYVREVIYNAERPIVIDPSVYIQLTIRRSPILPNLSVFECSGDFDAAEVVLFLESPLHTVRLLGMATEFAHAAVLSMLSSKTLNLSTLVLVNRPAPLISERILLRGLTSVEIRGVTGTLSESFLVELESIPSLNTLITDFKGWPVSHFTQPGDHPIFAGLTRLDIRMLNNDIPPIIPAFLSRIATSRLRSFRLILMGAPQGFVGMPSMVAHDRTFDILTSRWSTTLHDLGPQNRLFQHD